MSIYGFLLIQFISKLPGKLLINYSSLNQQLVYEHRNIRKSVKKMKITKPITPCINLVGILFNNSRFTVIVKNEGKLNGYIKCKRLLYFANW